MALSPAVPADYQVRYLHLRTQARYPVRPDLTYPQTRATLCTIRDTEGRAVATGLAICNPGDQFCRRIGRQIAFGRAVKELHNGPRSEKRGPQVRRVV